MKTITDLTRSDAIELFDRHVSSGKVAFYQNAQIDLILGKRSGCWMYDLDGRKWLNCHSNGGVFNLGHRHPRVIAALQNGLAELDIGNHHLISESRARLAARLAASAPGNLNRVVYGVSGGEAVDMAIKIARGHTGRPEILSAIGGYHGHTGFALAAGDSQYSRPFGPLPPAFKQVPFGDITELHKAISNRTAAVLMETIPATLGIVVPPEEFFSEVRQLCDDHGALMILDEIQTGLGRCGAAWGIQTFGVAPDILVTGKGLSGGIYPITATIYDERLNAFLHENPFIHISTFGGAELGCHVAIEVLNILEEPGFLGQVRKMATLFDHGLSSLSQRYKDVLTAVHQRGLMMGLKLTHPTMGPAVSTLGLEHGLFMVYANNDPSVVQLLPPLIIQEDEVAFVLEGLNKTFRDLKDHVKGE